MSIGVEILVLRPGVVIHGMHFQNGQRMSLEMRLGEIAREVRPLLHDGSIRVENDDPEVTEFLSRGLKASLVDIRALVADGSIEVDYDGSSPGLRQIIEGKA